VKKERKFYLSYGIHIPYLWYFFGVAYENFLIYYGDSTKSKAA